MTPNDYAEFQPKYSKYEVTYNPVSPIAPHLFRSGHQRLQAAIVGLAAEAGELLGVLQKANRNGVPIPRDRALDELSDVRWYYEFAMRELGVTDDEVTDYNKRKLDERNA